MKTSSAKAKGRDLQKAVVRIIRETFPWLTERDVQSTSMGSNGADVKLSEAAFKEVPFAIECKNIAAFVGYTYLDQAEDHADAEGGIPLAVVKANGRSPVVILDLEYFMEILQHTERSHNGT